MPNPYQAFLYPRAKLGMILQELASKEKQGISTFIMRILLERFEKEFVEKWGIDAFASYHNELLATMDEQTKLKEQKKREKIAKEKEKIERQRKALKLKDRELAIRERNLKSKVDEKAIRARIKELRDIMKTIRDRDNLEWQKAHKELFELLEKYPFLNK